MPPEAGQPLPGSDPSAPPISLELPPSPERDFAEWAQERRRRRIRTEIYGGGALLVLGIIGSVALRNTTLLIVAMLSVAALGAYELLVTSLE